MKSKRVNTIVDRFVSELTETVLSEAMDRIRSQLESAAMEKVRSELGIRSEPEIILGSTAAPTVKRRKSTKGKSMLRPCPVKGCKQTAAPRFRMVCKAHHDKLSRDEILLARAVAAEPGGIWANFKKKKKSA